MNALVLAAALTAPAHPPQLPPPPPVVIPQPVVVPQPVVIAPAVRVQPQVVPVVRPVAVPVAVPQPVFVPQPPAAISLGDFSRFFTPTPGKHHVWVIHPVTRQPVEVCFTLPPGQLKEFKVDRREIRFEFRGGYEVEIEFRHNGTVRVRYDD
jgi:hypothetical protein